MTERLQELGSTMLHPLPDLAGSCVPGVTPYEFPDGTKLFVNNESGATVMIPGPEYASVVRQLEGGEISE